MPKGHAAEDGLVLGSGLGVVANKRQWEYAGPVRCVSLSRRRA